MTTLYNYTQQFDKSWDGLTYANQLYNVFSRYSNKFSHTEDTNFITIDNKLTLKVSAVGDGWPYLRMKIDVWDTDNNVSVRGMEMGISYGVYSIQLYSGEDSLTFKVGNDYIVIVFKSNNLYFATDSSRGGPIGIDAPGYAFVESSSFNTTYHVKKIADYSLSVRDLFFSETCILVSDGGNYVVISDYSSCSTVTKFTTLALRNKTYFAIGTNTLIEFEEASE